MPPQSIQCETNELLNNVIMYDHRPNEVNSNDEVVKDQRKEKIKYRNEGWKERKIEMEKGKRVWKAKVEQNKLDRKKKEKEQEEWKMREKKKKKKKKKEKKKRKREQQRKRKKKKKKRNEEEKKKVRAKRQKRKSKRREK